MARAVIAPLVGDVQRREGDDRALERTALPQVPADRPKVLDEAHRVVRRRPPLEIDYRRAAGPADKAADGRRVCRGITSAHRNQATKTLIDADDVRAVFVALHRPFGRIDPDDRVTWAAHERVRYPAAWL
jgi:hypothetical protein